jgi:hypothetical protein
VNAVVERNETYHTKYWNLLKELKVHVLYLQGYATAQYRWDRGVDIFLAIASSSSIAGWALWRDYQAIWAIIIALSQVMTAIKPLLPYKKRLAALTSLGDEISKLSLAAERDWYFVAEGVWAAEKIHTKWADLKDKSFAAERKCLNGLTLPVDKAALEAAQVEADLYLQSTYF